MNQIFIIILFLTIGIFAQRISQLPPNLAAYLNKYLIYIVLPALALLYLPVVELRAELALPILSAWISFGFSWIFFGFLGKKLNWTKSVTGCLIITAGLANTSFVGFPIINALYGEGGVQIALLIDQAGSFIIVSSLAIIVASIYSADKKRKRDISKKIITFPPFIFFLFAMFLNLFKIELPQTAQIPLEWIALTLTPVALTAVGLQVKITKDAFQSTYLWLGLGYKLVLIPSLILLLFSQVFNLKGLLLEVSVMETAMAPMITGSIIAITHHLEPKLASLLVGVGIPLSFATLAAWYGVLTYWF